MCRLLLAGVRVVVGWMHGAASAGSATECCVSVSAVRARVRRVCAVHLQCPSRCQMMVLLDVGPKWMGGWMVPGVSMEGDPSTSDEAVKEQSVEQRSKGRSDAAAK